MDAHATAGQTSLRRYHMNLKCPVVILYCVQHEELEALSRKADIFAQF